MNMRPIPGFPNYAVSDCGRVWNTKFNWEVKPNRHSNGYRLVHLRHARKRYARYVHRLVLSAFVRQPARGDVANHKNFDRTDNRLENLEWTTQKRNVAHAWAGGRAPGHCLVVRNKETIDKMLADDWKTIDIANHFGCHQSAIQGYLRTKMSPAAIKDRAQRLREPRARDPITGRWAREL